MHASTWSCQVHDIASQQLTIPVPPYRKIKLPFPLAGLTLKTDIMLDAHLLMLSVNCQELSATPEIMRAMDRRYGVLHIYEI